MSDVNTANPAPDCPTTGAASTPQLIEGTYCALDRNVPGRGEHFAAHLEAIYRFALASEMKDAHTGAHLRRIAAYSHALALSLDGDPDMADAIAAASILHDVGKLHVPDAMLNKPGALTPEEWTCMQRHTTLGRDLLPNDADFRMARRIAAHHHENWDGSGYPDGLAQYHIPWGARLVRVADVYDALISRRPYKPAWPRRSALAYIADHAGHLFDPAVVRAFIALADRHRLNPTDYTCTLVGRLREQAVRERLLVRQGAERGTFHLVALARADAGHAAVRPADAEHGVNHIDPRRPGHLKQAAPRAQHPWHDPPGDPE